MRIHTLLALALVMFASAAVLGQSAPASQSKPPDTSTPAGKQGPDQKTAPEKSAAPGQDTSVAPIEAPTGQEPSVQTFRKSVGLVNILFNVKDKHGRLIPRLEKDQFELLEDGKPQTIKFFSAQTNLPLTLGLLIDTSESMRLALPEEQVVASEFLHQVINEKDLAFVLSFDIRADLLQDLTSDFRLLRAGLEKAHTNWDPSGAIPGVGDGPVPTANRPKGTVLFDATWLAASEVLGQQAGRKPMVIVTDGVDVGSKIKIREAIEAAQKADVVCYVILFSGSEGSNYFDMKQLTEQTGGRTISVPRPDKMRDAFAQISEELRSQYSLSYSSSNDIRTGGFRKVEIKSKDGYKIQARKGYYPPAELAQKP
ncbi:MAG TPA: VWA domain-containing protein [Alphaproteobacteria bacterium]|nr:VWA domain-containing protein [Alphaproteobacteria bacterium]